jgi:GntR family transcriptional regulator
MPRTAVRTVAALAGDQRLPRYERLRASLAQRVRAGEWGPGEALPAEAALAEAYGVALGTMRRAVGLLVEDGLLERRHGSGTYVRQGDAFASSMFRFFRLSDEAGRPLTPEGRLLLRKVVAAPPEARAALGLSPKAQCIRMSRLRLIGGEPLLAEDIVLPLGPFREFLALPSAEVPPLLYPLYAERCGQVIARAEETLTVEACPAAQARLLRRAAGSPVVVIERIAFGLDDKPKEWRRSYGPAERFHYRVDIR